MYRKNTLYIDIDDTIIAEVLPGSGRDLRPCVITQLTVLGQLFDCCWLTSWPYSPAHAPSYGMCVQTLMHALYAHRVNETFRYARWDHEHPDGKAGFVLSPDQPEEWYWLEDPIPAGERDALAAAGKLDRYIPVDPQGPWGFLDAVNELFVRTGITRSAFDRVGARPAWFDRTALLF
ncbi:hypothetical protein [Occallatibacter savannae]|uniref:hypothetical protein n=1 Tax=Occallatibacter savannae TaxID=1002691 RepID=UPI000D691344|nr:hypothetical protein [Occallatibacter savannae]